MAEPNARDAKLIQYLNEAYGKEKQLETALEAHIAMTSRDTYKKRLQQHLRETKSHGRELERRIKQLGGKAEAAPIHVPEPLTEAATVVTEVAQRGVALAQGPLHAVRGTSQEEKQLKNAKDEYSEEAQEIAMYTAIQSLAESVSDRQTARLASSIRRQEERMAAFLQRVIPQLAKAVAQAEIPAAERRTPSRGGTARRATTRRTAKRSGTARRTTARRSTRRTSGTRRTTGSRRSTGTRKTTARRTTASRRTTGSSRSTGTRKTATRRTTARRKTTRASR